MLQQGVIYIQMHFTRFLPDSLTITLWMWVHILLGHALPPKKQILNVHKICEANIGFIFLAHFNPGETNIFLYYKAQYFSLYNTV